MTIISPRTGLNFVKAGIKRTLQQDIEDFDILYKQSPQEIFIRVYNYTDEHGTFFEKKSMKYNEGDKLFKIINAMLLKELKPGREIVKALISYSQMIVILTSKKMVTEPITVNGEIFHNLKEITETKTIKL